MLKIVKSSRVYSQGESVSIDNTVNFPPPPESEKPENDGEFISQAEIIRQQQEEERKKREEEERIASEISREVEAIKADIERKHTEFMNLTELERKEIISAAEKQSEEIIKKAGSDAEDIKKKAEEEGYSEGLKKGYDESIAKCQNYVETAAQFLTSINKKKEAYFASHEDALTEAVMEMVRKITLAEVKTDKDTVFRILKQAAKKFKNDKSIKISFADGDVSEEMVTDLDFIRSVVGSIPDIEVEILPDAEEGTVIIDNGSEIIDASVPTQLDLLKEIMNNTRGTKTDPQEKE